MSETFSERCCGTCRHWARDEGYFDAKDQWVEPETHHCTLLVIVAAHRWQKPYEKGDIVTRGEAWERDLAVASLRTEWHHGCRGWNRETPIANRWKPIDRHPHEGRCRCPWCIERLHGVAS